MTFPDRVRRHRSKLVSLVLLLAAAVAALVFWDGIAAWFSGEPVGGTRSAAITAGAGSFEVSAAIAPDPPREKGSTLFLTVRDAEGEAVEDAEIDVTYLMPAMGSMPEMRGKADVEEEGGGSYTAELDLPMGGSWSLIVQVEKGEASGEARLGMTVGTKGLTAEAGRAAGDAPEQEEPRGPEISPLEAQELPAPVLGKLQTALVAYEEIRDLLAADTVDGIEPHATALAATLREAAEGSGGGVADCLREAAEVAAALEDEDDVDTARLRFGDLSKYFVVLGATDPRLTEGWFVFECPMAEGYPKWVQRSHEIDNPYMGTRMLTCGSRSDWAVADAAAAEAHVHAADGGEVAYYTCSMHPSVKQEKPGTCPICAMDLTPVTREELETGTILIDEDRRRRIGVKLAPVTRKQMVLPIRAVGEVVHDETKLHDVNLRMSGWVERLVVDETGQRVRRGQTLFTLYSPELFAAQLEYLNAIRGRETAAASPALKGTTEALIRASRQRLELLGMPSGQLERLARRGEAWKNVPIPAPASGYIIEKHVVEGAQVEAGTLVYRVADLDQVWVEARVYESDLAHVRVGQEVEVTLPYVPGRTYQGEVDYVYPTLEGRTRTGKVRVVLPNPELELKPEMYANVVFQADLGERLVIPESAVIYTGPRRVVFVDLGGGRLRPQVVELGARTGDLYEVLDGLEAGDVVVTSGNFLIASESRLKSASDLWSGGEVDASD